ncbi:MAG: hypothetical protein IKD66_03340 [Solobacterium sp.]|nr:hypothetical protein [Solobacterium sp.]
MGLFKPIWESNNRRKLEDYISKTHDGGTLVKIALDSCVPEARDAALRMLMASHPTYRMYYNEELMARFVLKGAFTAWALDFIKSKDLLARLGAQLPDSKPETILKCALRSGNRDLLARSALLTKQLVDWNKAFDPLLSDPAYAREVKAHLEALKAKDQVKRSAAEKAADAKRQAEAEQRQKKKEARKDDPLSDPLRYLRAARDKEDAEARWRAYYTRQLSSDRNTLLDDLSHRLNSLSWTGFFPSGAAARLCECALPVCDDQGWLMTKSEIQTKAESELNLVLSKLYEARSDLHAEIIALDGTLFSKASGEADAYDFQGDPGEHRIETVGSVPRLIMHVVPDGKAVRITLVRG